MHLIHDNAGNSCLFKDYKRIQFIHDEPDNSAWVILHETPFLLFPSSIVTFITCFSACTTVIFTVQDAVNL